MLLWLTIHVNISFNGPRPSIVWPLRFFFVKNDSTHTHWQILCSLQPPWGVPQATGSPLWGVVLFQVKWSSLNQFFTPVGAYLCKREIFVNEKRFYVCLWSLFLYSNIFTLIEAIWIFKQHQRDVFCFHSLINLFVIINWTGKDELSWFY